MLAAGDRVAVSVPASSANLGPGFDSFGVALDLRNDFFAELDDEWSVEIEGEGADHAAGEQQPFGEMQPHQLGGLHIGDVGQQRQAETGDREGAQRGVERVPDGDLCGQGMGSYHGSAGTFRDLIDTMSTIAGGIGSRGG